MKKLAYQFKHPSWGDDWQDIESQWGHNDLEYIAHDIAESYYNDEPCDPYRFDFVVEVRQLGSDISKKFRVSAEADVNFYPREIDEQG